MLITTANDLPVRSRNLGSQLGAGLDGTGVKTRKA